MTRVIFFDCFSGISGDMALGALLDAGLSLEALRGELGKLPISGWSLDARRDMRGFLAGTRAVVDAPEQATHRHLADVRALIEGSTLDPQVQRDSMLVFTLLAEAEGAIHGLPADEVHFHEVGALDAIVDIVGVVAGLRLLGIEQVYAGPVAVGGGWVRAAHGMLPVPAPATLNLLAAANATLLPDTGIMAELTTPTGAALLAGLATFARPPMAIDGVGYGLGKRDLERPNALRVWLGTTSPAPAVDPAGDLVLLETNIDDQPAEQLAYVAEQSLHHGALDVWHTPIIMKKGRPALLLAVLAHAQDEQELVTLLMRETTTLGVRRRVVQRHTSERNVVTVETPFGAVRLKGKRWHGEELGVAPEYDDCARLARQHNVPVRDVYTAALEAFQRLLLG